MRELRVALVCYGGVSLAIYMHGVTKEIHKLVRASRAFEADQQVNPFAGDPGKQTEEVYWRALQALRDRHDHSVLRVSVDIIAGTSAGGINGVVLAKALAHDLSQDQMRDLWLVEGDIGRLLHGPRWLPWKLRASFWARSPVRRLRKTSTPLRGDYMSQQLYQALKAMNGTGTPDGCLVPDGASLDLFVTMTDLRGYRRFIPIQGRVVDDRTHQHVMHFRHDRATGLSELDERHDRALAFSARASSSFPGAFPPVSLAEFDADVGSGEDQDEVRTFFAAYREGFDSVGDSWFIDGGVLDNAPFGHAVAAIKDKPASTEVERWLLFLEPDPADADLAAQGQGRASRRPSLGATLYNALSAIPRREPILDDLVALREHGERVGRLSRLVEHYSDNLPAALATVAQQASNLPDLSVAEVSELMHDVHQEARAASGPAYWSYKQLELQQLGAYLAEAFSEAFAYPRESSQAALVRAVMTEWMRLAHPDPFAPPTEAFLNAADAPFRDRRLRFLVQGLNTLYPRADVPRRDVDEAKAATFGHLTALARDTAPRRLARTFRDADVGLFGDERLADYLRSDAGPLEFVNRHQQELDALVDSVAAYLDERMQSRALALLDDLGQLCRKWHDAVATILLVRFVGFPMWDTLIQPLLAVSDLEQFSPIRVSRLSPDDAVLLRRDDRTGTGFDAEDKLAGTRAGHFGAFFSRRGREQDYLWGRLDGVEQLLGLLSGGRPDPRLVRDAMGAVLAEEARTLTRARGLMGAIARTIEERAGPGAG